MQLNFKLEHFEGPLDLLLHLIEKDKVDIYDIPISEITSQYLSYVSSMEEEDLDIMSSFLLMASTLLEIKSRMLLPREVDEETGEEIDPRQELVERLLEYKKYKFLGEVLQNSEDSADELFYRAEHLPVEVEKYVPPLDLDQLFEGFTKEKLRTIFRDVMMRKENSIDRVRAGFGVIRREKISLSARILDVFNYAKQHRHFSFRHMVRHKHEKMDIVVSFLAVLELMKMGRITLVQERPFADMNITAVVPENGDGEMAAEELKNVEDFD